MNAPLPTGSATHYPKGWHSLRYNIYRCACRRGGERPVTSQFPPSGHSAPPPVVGSCSTSTPITRVLERMYFEEKDGLVKLLHCVLGFYK